MFFNYHNKKAFTLIELLVVIVIIGILATLATIALTSVRAKARDAKRVSDVKQIQTALELYHADHNTFPPPSVVTANQALVNVANDKTYMVKVPADPSTRQSYGYFPVGLNNYQLAYNLEKGSGDLSGGSVVVSTQGSANMNGLIGWWPLNDGSLTQDLGPGAFNGTWSGTSTVRYHNIGNAYGAFFNGVSDYISAGTTDDLSPTKEITIAAWVYYTSTPTLDTTVLSKGRSSTYKKIYWLHRQNNVWSFTIGDGVYNGVDILSHSISLDNNTWHHVVATFNQGVMKLYFNGDLKASKTSTLVFGIDTSGYGFKIGAYLSGAYSMSGYLRDVRVYERELSDAEIKAIRLSTKVD